MIRPFPIAAPSPVAPELAAAPKRELGPKQRAWLNEKIPVFADAAKRAAEVAADTERLKQEAGQ